MAADKNKGQPSHHLLLGADDEQGRDEILLLCPGHLAPDQILHRLPVADLPDEVSDAGYRPDEAPDRARVPKKSVVPIEIMLLKMRLYQLQMALLMTDDSLQNDKLIMDNFLSLKTRQLSSGISNTIKNCVSI